MTKRASVVLVGVLLAWLPVRGQAPATPVQNVPIILELFTSEGCSSCPPADALMQKLVDSQPVARVQVLALGEHVDYWDQLGWRDRFSSASLTHRQQVYGARFGGDSVYTPQMIVDGRTAFVGSDAGAARQALEQTAKLPHGRVRITVDDSTAASLNCSIAWSELPPGGERADVVVAVTEDGLSSNVTRGENHGRVLAHAAVVRHLAVAGEAAKDGPATLRAQIPVGGDWRRDRLKIVAFVQERRSRAILAAGATSVPGR